MNYPVSAQYAQLAGFAGMCFGKAKPSKPRVIIPRAPRFEVRTVDQVLNAVRACPGATMQQIITACPIAKPKGVRSEVSRMIDKDLLRAEGEGRKHRYWVNV